MGDIGRRPEQNSPKSSPRGSRSPAYPRQDSTGTLKATITLGKNPSVIHSGPFYLMKEPPGKCPIYRPHKLRHASGFHASCHPHLVSLSTGMDRNEASRTLLRCFISTMKISNKCKFQLNISKIMNAKH